MLLQLRKNILATISLGFSHFLGASFVMQQEGADVPVRASKYPDVDCGDLHAILVLSEKMNKKVSSLWSSATSTHTRREKKNVVTLTNWLRGLARGRQEWAT